MIRWLLRLFGDTVSQEVIAIAAPVPDDGPEPISISAATLWESSRSNQPEIRDAKVIFAPAKPAPGVLPAGMAMDEGYTSAPQLAALTGWAMQGAWHEGLRFMGYPYLAELAQRAEYRMMAEKWAEHATRKWIEITGLDDEEKLHALTEFLGEGDKGIKLRSVFQQAIEGDWLFGRMQIFLDFGQVDGTELEKPLLRVEGKVNPTRPLKSIRTVEPMWTYPGPYESTNPLHPDFYRPDVWYVSGQTVHTSRLLTIVGREVPDLLKAAYAFGGLSMTQMAKPYVDNWLRARQSAADTLESFSQWVLKTNMGNVLAGGAADEILKRVSLFNNWRRSKGTAVINKDSEEIEVRSVTLSGIDKLQAQAQEHLSSVSGIPLVILLGVTPSGLNASSDGEIQSFYAAVHNYQEKTCRQPIQTVLDLAQLSLWGTIDPKISFEFVELYEMDENEAADVEGKKADTHGKYVNMGVVSNEEVRDKVTAEKGHAYHGLTGPAPEMDDEDEGNDE